jgi:hypothetical protein
LFAFSSPQTAWKRQNREKFRSARLFAKIRWVFARPRSRAGGRGRHGNFSFGSESGQAKKRADSARVSHVNVVGPAAAGAIARANAKGSRRSVAEINPATVALAKKLARVNGRRRSLRDVAAELKTAGYLTSKGTTYGAAAVARMIAT